jgi:NAD(P)H-hydrate epimerase
MLDRYNLESSVDQYFQAISANDAASLDKDLMDMGGWSLDQLMELAGLSVSQAGQLLPLYAL